ncbi:MAG: sigma-54-dependent Fis family transcriptional regulator [Granulosicoccus sp.]|nr:sigma-54-dependent Fis family transcriptional regulator [Granulosicoccus sp.]
MDAAVDAMKNGAFDFVSKPVDISLLRSLVTQAIIVREGHSTETLPGTDGTAGADKIPGGRKASGGRLASPLHSSQESTHPFQDTEPASDSQTPGGSARSLSQLSGRQSAPADDSTLIGQGRLIGHSEPMKALRRMIAKVARTNAPVWISGESGTGKELIARLIHENGPRASAQFVAINCGAIPSELMESEMFGHRKGSFTGAHAEHDGLFQRARGGTLFLDEVAELPLQMQVKLLRAIQERTIRPVGSAEEIGTDVRILSASHKDLAAEVEHGRFRHDLYYRLNVICIQAPSLRQRADDVACISQHILNAISRAEGHERLKRLTSEAEQRLSAYAFPGNVRELENILERAVALSEGDTIDVDDLNIQENLSERMVNDQYGLIAEPGVDQTERQLINDALKQTRWNRKLAAEKLGMTYRQLRYRIHQYGIDKD